MNTNCDQAIHERCVARYHDSDTTKIKTITTYLYSTNIRDGPFRSFYENGNKKEVCTYKDDKCDKKYKSFYENGDKKEVRTYKDGEINGPDEVWYQNGHLQSIAANNMCFRWNTDGSLIIP